MCGRSPSRQPRRGDARADAGECCRRRAAAPATGRGFWTAGFGGRADAYRTRRHFSEPFRPTLHQLASSGGAAAPPRALDFRAAGQRLRQLAEHLRRLMVGRHFGNHLAVVGGGAEKLRLERNDRERIAFQRLGEVCRGDFRPLRHADLIEAVMRPMIVRPRGLEQIDHVLGIAQIGEIGPGDHENVVGAHQDSPRPGRSIGAERRARCRGLSCAGSRASRRKPRRRNRRRGRASPARPAD